VKRNSERLTFIVITTASLLVSLYTFVPAIENLDTPYHISLPSNLGNVTDFYLSQHLPHTPHPDFVLIQNAHCNLHVQYAISAILRQLKWQGVLPDRIAVEGAVGPVDVLKSQQFSDGLERRREADDLISQGEISGVMHYAISEGEGQLYGVESADLYRSSIEMFRRSYWARTILRRDLNKLDSALSLIKAEPGLSARASILSQDIQVLRGLVDQRLFPEDIHRTVNRSIFAVDHLKDLLPGDSGAHLLEAVSASVDFYALALLRDEALLKHAIELRHLDHQSTTVIVTGGFHSAGLAKRLKEMGFSYVVIRPDVQKMSKSENHQYIERIMGYPIPERSISKVTEATAIDLPDLGIKIPLQKEEVWKMASDLRERLPNVNFSIPAQEDIFTAMDLPWLPPPVKAAIIHERSGLISEPFTSRDIAQIVPEDDG
jgi:hypothetical protein